MSLVFSVWIAIGVATGVAHAVGLWRSAHRWHTPPLEAAWRIPVVVACLVAAALAGGVLAAAGGWTCGFAAASALLSIRNVS